MRKIIPLIIGFSILLGSIIARAQTDNQTAEPAEQDSTIAMIGYFPKDVGLVYSINKSTWQLIPGDTVLNMRLSTIGSLTMVDSTSTGYKMAFKFMEVYGQTPENDDQPISIMKVFTEIISKLIVGKTISFDTDDCGHITQFNNLDDIKAEIDSMLPVDLGKILNTPALSVLKDNDLDFSESDLTIANILIDSYVEDIQLMFIRYGTIYNIGEFHVHEDATETDYEHDTYASAVLDPSDGMIVLTTEVIHTIPGEDLREMVDGLIDIPDDEAMVESYNREMEALKGCDWVMDSYLRTSFLPESWPLGVLREKIVKIGEKGKIKRTYILFEGLE